MQRIRNLVVWMTENCNLNCSYCYECKRPKSFDAVAVKSRVQTLFEEGLMNWGADQHTISFFGGEPLLEFGAMKDFVAWLEDLVPRPFRYSVTTNGTLITAEIAEFLATKEFGMLFSIDGDREAMLARSDSYDASVAGFTHVKAVGLSPEANMTFRPDQLGRWRENIEHVIELGFTSFNLNPLEGTNYDFAETLAAFRAVYCAYMEEWLPLGIRTSSLSKPFTAFRAGGVQHGCGAGKGFVAIAPDGEVYPCHHMVQMPAMAMGSARGILPQQKEYWERFDPRQNEKCTTCLVRPYCRGSCAAVNAFTTGDLHLPYAGDCAFRKAHILAAQETYLQCTEEQIQEVIGE